LDGLVSLEVAECCGTNIKENESLYSREVARNLLVSTVPLDFLATFQQESIFMKLLMKSMVLVSLATVMATVAQAGTVYVGNSLSSTGQEDSSSSPPFVILGEYDSTGPLGTSSITLPTGTVQDVKFYGGNYNFTLYALSLVSSGPGANEQTFHVVDSESFSGSASPGIQTLSVSGFSVTAGDLLGFAGVGPFYPQTANDALNSDATYGSGGSSFTATPPGASSTFSVGLFGDTSANYTYINDFFGNQGRTYSIGVDVSTSVVGAVPDSASTLLLAGSMMATLAALRRRCFTTR
jgi:hypothetical protein